MPISAQWRERMAALYPDLLRRVGDGTDLRWPEFHGLIVAALAAGQDVAPLVRQHWPIATLRQPLVLSSLSTVAEWCAARDIAVNVIEAPTDIALPASTAHSKAYAYRTEPAILSVIPDARWIPGWDFVIASDETVLSDSGYVSITTSYPVWPQFCVADAVAHHRPTEEVEVAEAVYLSAPTDENMGHWFIDFLPRLLGRSGAPGAPVLVPADISAKQLDTLEMMGVGRDSILRCARGTIYRIGRLHLYRPGCSMPPNPSHVGFVRNALSRHRPRPAPGKRIYVSRESVGTRRVVNQDEFQLLLAEAGFIAVDPAYLTIAQQQDLFADAEIIMGPFGTNLLTLYLAPPGCAVIALMSEVSDDNCVAPTAAMLGMKHQFLQCARSVVAGKQRQKKDTDIVVDCAELRRRLS